MIDSEALNDTIAESDTIPDDAYPVALFNASGARSRMVAALLHASGQKGPEWLSLLLDPSGTVNASPDEQPRCAILELRAYDNPTWATLRTWNLAAWQFQKTPIYQKVGNVLLKRGWFPSTDGNGQGAMPADP